MWGWKKVFVPCHTPNLWYTQSMRPLLPSRVSQLSLFPCFLLCVRAVILAPRFVIVLTMAGLVDRYSRFSGDEWTTSMVNINGETPRLERF